MHGAPVTYFEYVLDKAAAARAFAATDAPLIFIGHTHIAESYALRPDGSLEHKHWQQGGTFTLDAGTRYIVNVGSVGQPRDLNPQASMAFYEPAAATLTISRFAYPIARVQERLPRHICPKHSRAGSSSAADFGARASKAPDNEHRDDCADYRACGVDRPAGGGASNAATHARDDFANAAFSLALRGGLRAFFKRDFPAARSGFERALRVVPDNTLALAFLNSTALQRRPRSTRLSMPKKKPSRFIRVITSRTSG